MWLWSQGGWWCCRWCVLEGGEERGGERETRGGLRVLLMRVEVWGRVRRGSPRDCKEILSNNKNDVTILLSSWRKLRDTLSRIKVRW